MLKFVVSVLLGLSLAFGGLTYAKTAKKRTTAKSGTVAASKKSAKRPVKRSSRSRRSASKKGTRSKNTIVRRSTQKAPTRERYMEIQQALAEKGYYEGSVDGTWSPGSVEALKRFQRDQNLKGNGKLDSLTIIALGLGPKRNLSARSTTESRPTEDDYRRPEGSERP